MPSVRGERNATQALAAAALTLGLLAMIAGDPARARDDSADGAARAGVEKQQEGGISAIELARVIRDRSPGVRVIEVRPPGDSDGYRIPGAEPMTFAGLAATRFDSSETIVLYSDVDTRAEEGRKLLHGRGHARAFFLRGSLFAWVDEVMEARIPADASESERDAFSDVAALSRYFGGQPTISDRPRSASDAIPSPAPRDPAARAAKSGKAAAGRLERRGC